jgi:hypothetical protein
MKPSPGVALLLGVWLGASGLVLYVAQESFTGLPRSLEVNPEIARRAGIDPEREAELKSSALWVQAAEFNRALFHVWNRVQLALVAVTLLTALLRCPRRGVILSLIAAGITVTALTFYLAPQITSLGRELDFVPRQPRPAGLETSTTLHQLYLVLEVAKTALVALAALLAIRAPRPRPV